MKLQKILENENVIIESIDQIIEYLDLIVVHKQTKIIFIVLIPLLRKDVLEHQLLEPVAKDGKLLNLNFKEALNNNHSTYLITGECTSIGESIICSEQHLKDVSHDTCYSKILRGMSGHCDLIEATMTRQVKRISSNHVIITGDGSTPIASNCGLSNRNISGNTLIFFRNCTVIVNHTSFTDIEYVSKQQPVLIPLDGLEIVGKTVSVNFTLQKLKEINLQTRKELQFLHTQQKNSTLGTSLVITAVVITLILYLSKVHSTCIPKPHNLNGPGRSVLQEGAVTEPIQSSPNIKPSAAPTTVIETSNISIPSAPMNQQLTSVASPTANEYNTISISSTSAPTRDQRLATSTTTTTRSIGTARTADIAGHPTPRIRT